ncbi:MAG: phosphatidylserine decarboxylase family protein [Candidatus Heimdallarchaeota archaeon]|nr:phosphatidylserine decarboxylase family protein [Candidatus Heimdallarchaeota archaeon]
MVFLANGHQIGSLALITLFPVILVYSLVFPFLGILVPVLFLGLCFHLFFYRDPEREIKFEDLMVYSPANGKVFEVDPNKNVVRIRMTLLDVHVTRMPVSGRIKEIRRQKGKYWPFLLNLYRGTVENTRQHITLETKHGEIELIQIAGMIARKIECYHEEETFLEQGERLGIIHYGSEVDLFLPSNKYEIIVQKGIKTVAGMTPIAKYSNKT